MPSLRPTEFDPNSGELRIQLRPEDVVRAYALGLARYSSQRGDFRPDGRYASRLDSTPYTPDIEGILGEIAFWLACGKEPPTDIVLTMPEWKRLTSGCQLADVLGIELRSGARREGRLIVHSTTQRDVGEHDVIFVLALLEKWPVYPEDKFTTGVPQLDEVLGKQPRDLQRYDTTVRFTGWAYGKDATVWFEGMPHPEWTVPAERMRPMDERPAHARAWPDNPWDSLLKVG